jgi:hypothetical protein
MERACKYGPLKYKKGKRRCRKKEGRDWTPFSIHTGKQRYVCSKYSKSKRKNGKGRKCIEKRIWRALPIKKEERQQTPSIIENIVSIPTKIIQNVTQALGISPTLSSGMSTAPITNWRPLVPSKNFIYTNLEDVSNKRIFDEKENIELRKYESNTILEKPYIVEPAISMDILEETPLKKRERIFNELDFEQRSFKRGREVPINVKEFQDEEIKDLSRITDKQPIYKSKLILERRKKLKAIPKKLSVSQVTVATDAEVLLRQYKELQIMHKQWLFQNAENILPSEVQSVFLMAQYRYITIYNNLKENNIDPELEIVLKLICVGDSTSEQNKIHYCSTINDSQNAENIINALPLIFPQEYEYLDLDVLDLKFNTWELLSNPFFLIKKYIKEVPNTEFKLQGKGVVVHSPYEVDFYLPAIYEILQRNQTLPYKDASLRSILLVGLKLDEFKLHSNENTIQPAGVIYASIPLKQIFLLIALQYILNMNGTSFLRYANNLEYNEKTNPFMYIGSSMLQDPAEIEESLQ